MLMFCSLFTAVRVFQIYVHVNYFYGLSILVLVAPEQLIKEMKDESERKIDIKK